MSALLRKRFGSSMRVDRARAALRNVKQSQNENVRAYSSRFESLLAKLPSYDVEWAKSQYIWGLNQRVAELVVIAEPADLQAAILKAEKIEMARGTVSWQPRPIFWKLEQNQQRKIYSRKRKIFCSSALIRTTSIPIRSRSNIRTQESKYNQRHQGQEQT